tara:strand:+ start:405 stop:608 length:204 start_codon:yes stop_codon:yes gene_type:complete
LSDEIENMSFHNFINREELGSFLNAGDDIGIGFRIQFFCKKCKNILSPNKLVQGCSKCQDRYDSLLI